MIASISLTSLVRCIDASRFGLSHLAKFGWDDSKGLGSSGDGINSHRARIRAAKNIAGKSASAIAETLGISPSASVSTSESTPAPTPPSSSTPTPRPSLSPDNLTTSTKSVADYFKEKLIARSSSSSSPASSSSSSPSRSGLGRGLSPPEDESELSRRGIDSQVSVVLLPPQVPEAG